MGKDAVGIADVFRRNATALEGRHAFTADQLQQLEADGNWLLQQLRPVGSIRDNAERTAEATTRDQIGAKMNRRYDEAYKAGVVLWGRREVDVRMPSLGSRSTQPTEADDSSGGSGETPVGPSEPTE